MSVVIVGFTFALQISITTDNFHDARAMNDQHWFVGQQCCVHSEEAVLWLSL